MKIAVVSGKGGVGKTTLSLRIAEALASKYSVALFDADITGSNTHLMLSIEKDIRVVGDKLIPAIARINGRKVEYVSISLVSDNYIRWEGNVVDDFISQVMNSTEWSAEHIIIDCPPGTHEDTIRSIELADVVVFVTIPAKFAKLDLERTIDLVRDIGKPVAGVFVNFSKVVCPIIEKEETGIGYCKIHGKVEGIYRGKGRGRKLRCPICNRILKLTPYEDQEKKSHDYEERHDYDVEEDLEVISPEEEFVEKALNYLSRELPKYGICNRGRPLEIVITSLKLNPEILKNPNTLHMHIKSIIRNANDYLLLDRPLLQIHWIVEVLLESIKVDCGITNWYLLYHGYIVLNLAIKNSEFMATYRANYFREIHENSCNRLSDISDKVYGPFKVELCKLCRYRDKNNDIGKLYRPYRIFMSSWWTVYDNVLSTPLSAIHHL